MALTLQDPELTSDAQRLTTFASAIAQASMVLYEFELNNGDKNSPEYSKIHEYWKTNFLKFKERINKLEADLG